MPFLLRKKKKNKKKRDWNILASLLLVLVLVLESVCDEVDVKLLVLMEQTANANLFAPYLLPSLPPCYF